jgi:hypothetical protein
MDALNERAAEEEASVDNKEYVDGVLATEEVSCRKCFSKEFEYTDKHQKKPTVFTCSNSDFCLTGNLLAERQFFFVPVALLFYLSRRSKVPPRR